MNRPIEDPWDFLASILQVKDLCKLVKSYIPPKCFHCQKELTFKSEKKQQLHFHCACYKKLYDQGRQRCFRCHGFKIECCMRKCRSYTPRCETCSDRRDVVDEYCAHCFTKTLASMQKVIAKFT